MNNLFALKGDTLIPFTELTVHSQSLSMRYGISLFEGIRGYKNKNGFVRFFKLKEHLERLNTSLRLMSLPEIDLVAAERNSYSLLDINKISEDLYLRISVNFDELGDLNGDFLPTVYMTVNKMGRKKWIAEGRKMKLKLSDIRKPSRKMFSQEIKNISNYATAKVALISAKKEGFDNVILRTSEGKVAESATSNIFCIRNGELYTPADDQDILKGITRKTVIEIAAELGIKTHLLPISEEDLFSMDEVFICGTGIEFASIGQVSEKVYEKSNIMEIVLNSYFQKVREV
ncbi:aminotransferase class IV [Leptospira santarosai]|uniref:aminotransferase class IV n=1 Tax=Leptospira santarosai TaxID=28183 RepID=UPI0002BE905E|nr:aminotransferase class IV [Leptospira santarosai]EMO73598.1 aminotransferase, class IV [Leptospira santarosai str. 200403458]EMO98234.1 aminotransferase, class IV [Leptospira santarosai str. 200702252]